MTTLRGLWIAALILVAASSASAATIRSWDDANQRGGDLFGGGGGSLEYGSLEAAILAAGHTILPGVSTLTAGNLAGVDVFFHGTSPHALSPAEGAALAAFVAGGGRLIVEANSIVSEQTAANSLLSALGLGTPYTGVVGGGQDADAGIFENVVANTTVGPFGDLRNLTFGSSVAVDIDPAGGVLVGRNFPIRSMVEFLGGSVLAVGDPYGFNIFTEPGELHFNPNNANAYLNFIGLPQEAPEPTALLFFGLGLASAAAYGRRRLS